MWCTYLLVTCNCIITFTYSYTNLLLCFPSGDSDLLVDVFSGIKSSQSMKQVREHITVLHVDIDMLLWLAHCWAVVARYGYPVCSVGEKAIYCTSMYNV